MIMLSISVTILKSNNLELKLNKLGNVFGQ